MWNTNVCYLDFEDTVLIYPFAEEKYCTYEMLFMCIVADRQTFELPWYYKFGTKCYFLFIAYVDQIWINSTFRRKTLNLLRHFVEILCRKVTSSNVFSSNTILKRNFSPSSEGQNIV